MARDVIADMAIVTWHATWLLMWLDHNMIRDGTKSQHVTPPDYDTWSYQISTCDTTKFQHVASQNFDTWHRLIATHVATQLQHVAPPNYATWRFTLMTRGILLN